MCLAIPMQIVETDGQHARVALEGNVREADVSLVEHAAVGDWVLLHAGFAIEKITDDEARETLSLLTQAAKAMEEEDV